MNAQIVPFKGFLAEELDKAVRFIILNSTSHLHLANEDSAPLRVVPVKDIPSHPFPSQQRTTLSLLIILHEQAGTGSHLFAHDRFEVQLFFRDQRITCPVGELFNSLSLSARGRLDKVVQEPSAGDALIVRN
jgi:hypothetical protein